MFATFLRIALQVLAGVGVGKLADKVAPDKIPTYPAEGVQTPGFNVPKIAWFIITMVIGAIITKWLGRKLNIKLLK